MLLSVFLTFIVRWGELTINSQVEVAMPGLVPSMNTLRVRLTIFHFY